MKNALLFLSIIFFSVVISFGSFCEEVAVREWSPYSGIAGLSSRNGRIAFYSTSSMPLLVTRDNVFINASRSKFMEIRMKSSKNYATGRMFFRRIGDPGFNYNNSFDFQTGLSNIYHRYIIDLGRNPNWFGTVTQLMLSPINEEGSVEIESIRFLEPSILLMGRAFWREFFTFEVPQLRTFNFIYGPKINGITVNIYIYYLMAALFALVLACELIKAGDLSKALNKSSKIMIITCLIFWMALDLRYMLDQARSVILDTQTFYGKSLKEKQALTTLGDFYGFLSFADSKIPESSGFNILHPPYYYFSEKAKYYLYPKYFDERSNYVLVYDPNKTLDSGIKEYMKKGYKIFSIYKEGEFIIKK